MQIATEAFVTLAPESVSDADWHAVHAEWIDLHRRLFRKDGAPRARATAKERARLANMEAFMVRFCAYRYAADIAAGRW